MVKPTGEWGRMPERVTITFTDLQAGGTAFLYDEKEELHEVLREALPFGQNWLDKFVVKCSGRGDGMAGRYKDLFGARIKTSFDTEHSFERRLWGVHLELPSNWMEFGFPRAHTDVVPIMALRIAVIAKLRSRWVHAVEKRAD